MPRQHLWDGLDGFAAHPPKSYATYQNAVKAAEKVINPDWPIRYIVAATRDGRYFPVALGMKAMEYGLHFKMCVVG
jgi:hypothetical protein